MYDQYVHVIMNLNKYCAANIDIKINLQRVLFYDMLSEKIYTSASLQDQFSSNFIITISCYLNV